ncbi:hypothetical protein CC79DRAFT_1396490 [Sarocladium strictum]
MAMNLGGPPGPGNHHNNNNNGQQHLDASLAGFFVPDVDMSPTGIRSMIVVDRYLNSQMQSPMPMASPGQPAPALSPITPIMTSTPNQTPFQVAPAQQLGNGHGFQQPGPWSGHGGPAPPHINNHPSQTIILCHILAQLPLGTDPTLHINIPRQYNTSARLLLKTDTFSHLNSQARNSNKARLLINLDIISHISIITAEFRIVQSLGLFTGFKITKHIKNICGNLRARPRAIIPELVEDTVPASCLHRRPPPREWVLDPASQIGAPPI